MHPSSTTGPSDVLLSSLDELSSRLIIDGANTVSMNDFCALSNAASNIGESTFSNHASKIAISLDSISSYEIPVLTHFISNSLLHLRNLLIDSAYDVDISTILDFNKHNIDTSVMHDVSVGCSLSDDRELVRNCVYETNEHLDNIITHLLVIEHNGADKEAINAVFRAYHTIKGLASFMKFTNIEHITHEIETMLDLVRTTQIVVDSHIADIILECTDLLRVEVTAIDQKSTDKTQYNAGNHTLLVDKIREIIRTSSSPPVLVVHNDDLLNKHIDGVMHDIVTGCSIDSSSINCFHNTQSTLAYKHADNDSNVGLILTRPERRIGDALSIRVDTVKLDQLMNLVCEMIVTNTSIIHNPIIASINDTKYLQDSSRLTKTASQIQQVIMSMRMVPIGIQFHKTARLVRDLARKANKFIDFEATGENTELDKSVAEQLSDPLLHMVRNSIDHGIETAEERSVRAKNNQVIFASRRTINRVKS